MKPEEIISDEEITNVHGYANFGRMTPREVVNDGVRKYAIGYTGGSTQVAILREHGLITKPNGAAYRANLTEKGKRYARSIPTIDPAAIREAIARAWCHEENVAKEMDVDLADAVLFQILALIGEKK